MPRMTIDSDEQLQSILRRIAELAGASKGRLKSANWFSLFWLSRHGKRGKGVTEKSDDADRAPLDVLALDIVSISVSPDGRQVANILLQLDNANICGFFCRLDHWPSWKACQLRRPSNRPSNSPGNSSLDLVDLANIGVVSHALERRMAQPAVIRPGAKGNRLVTAVAAWAGKVAHGACRHRMFT